MNYNDLEQVILDIGPSSDFVEGVSQIEPGRWTIACVLGDDAFELLVELDLHIPEDAQYDLMTVHSFVETSEGRQQAALNETLLLQGDRLVRAMIDENGYILIAQNTYLRSLTLDSFRDTIRQLCERTQTTRKAVSQVPASGGNDDTSSAEFVRV